MQATLGHARESPLVIEGSYCYVRVILLCQGYIVLSGLYWGYIGVIGVKLGATFVCHTSRGNEISFPSENRRDVRFDRGTIGFML